MEDLWVDSGVDERAEEHVTADAGEAIEVGDAHEFIVSRSITDAGRMAEAARRPWFMEPER